MANLGNTIINGNLKVLNGIAGNLTGNVTGNADTATAISSSTFTAASATNEERPVWISWTSSAKNKPCYTTGFTYNVSTTTLSVPKIKIGTADLGTDTKPIKLVAGVPTAVGADLAPANHTHTMSAISDLPGIVNNTAQGNLGWTASTSAHDKSLATVNTIAYWNGAYQGTTSNLAYCVKGAFGDVVTHAASDFAAASHALSLGTTLGSGNIVKSIGVSGHIVTMTKMTESDLINNLTEGSSPANRNDYIVAQYAAGGTTTKTYHRRKLAQIFAALDSSDITTALGFTPLSASDISGKADKATTLAGYGIGDAKIASGTITLGTDSITPLTAASTLNAAKLSGTIPASCYTDTNTHYTANLIVGASNTATANATTANTTTFINTVENGAKSGSIQLKGANNVSVAAAGGVVTITGPTLTGYVPTTRTVNNRALSDNISLTASDIGLEPIDDSVINALS